MFAIDLSDCNTVGAIHDAVDKALKEKTLVRSPRMARRWFRSRRIRGRVRFSVVFREYKSVPRDNPQLRDTLVCALVMEYSVDGDAAHRVYSKEIITY